MFPTRTVNATAGNQHRHAVLCYSSSMTFEEWLAYGVANGYCSEQVCDTHAGYPVVDLEHQLFEDGIDPCIHVVRLGTQEQWEENAQAMADLGQ